MRQKSFVKYVLLFQKNIVPLPRHYNFRRFTNAVIV